MARCPLAGHDENDQRREKDARLIGSWIRQGTIVLEFLGCLGLCGYGGYWIDRRWGAAPWGLLGGLLVGMGAGLYLMIREAARWTDDKR